eukprot:SAG31_NODE_1033_length_10230_cov_15.289014_4_plen_64_part_00
MILWLKKTHAIDSLKIKGTRFHPLLRAIVVRFSGVHDHFEFFCYEMAQMTPIEQFLGVLYQDK